VSAAWNDGLPVPRPLPSAWQWGDDWQLPDDEPSPVELDAIEHEPEDPLAWQERAICSQTDPEAFFPEKGGSTREAKKICVGCPVRHECLEYALTHEERFGIWGGFSERERRRIARTRVGRVA